MPGFNKQSKKEVRQRMSVADVTDVTDVKDGRKKRNGSREMEVEKWKSEEGRKPHICAIKNVLNFGRGCHNIFFPCPSF